ncbi:MAG: hypothetical protein HHJ17_05510 [Rhodoferax sp.]|uniref:hypothetical protein n=1 Tax=Rhodoferax sp. TaxID=50421 RepID=UPI00179354F5|nr:hypothetical protein [Rhodoferax sp.]NMM12988.1 hypothetical protein [Rhodoferax sp.]
MFDFLNKKHPKNEPPSSVSPISVTPSGSQQHSNVQRELIRVVLKDTLRLHGIPLNWLACEVILIARAPGDEELHIQLVVMKWNEQLLRYATALQQQLLHGLDRFDPSVDHSRYIVSWRFTPDSGCPAVAMPDPKVWLQSTLPPANEVPASVLDRRSSRRAPNAPALSPSPSGTPAPSPDFSATQMSPLQ